MVKAVTDRTQAILARTATFDVGPTTAIPGTMGNLDEVAVTTADDESCASIDGARG